MSKVSAQTALQRSGYVESFESKFGYEPVQISGKLVTGEHFYFRARGAWITVQFSADAECRLPLRLFLSEYKEPRKSKYALSGAGVMSHREAVKMLLDSIERFTEERALGLRGPGESLFLLKPEADTPHGPSSGRRRQVAAAAAKMGVKVITIDAPGDRIMVCCMPHYALYLGNLPYMTRS